MFQKKAAVNAKDEKKTVTKKKKSGNVKAKLISVLKVVVLPALFAGIVVCGLYLSMQNKLEAESLKGQVLVMKENVAANTYVKAEDMDKYFETYPGVKRYQEKVIAMAKEKGYTETMFGRKRPMPELKASNYMMRQFGERVAMNAPIQGTAADIMKIAMINVFFKLKEEGLKSRLILQIHDELVIETATDEADKVTALLTKEMEKAVTLSVPMEVDCHIGTDWYEAK